MSDRQQTAERAAQHDSVSARPASGETGAPMRWNQIVEWTDEDMARWRDAHKQPDRPQF